jgi:hypothetical protein
MTLRVLCILVLFLCLQVCCLQPVDEQLMRITSITRRLLITMLRAMQTRSVGRMKAPVPPTWALILRPWPLGALAQLRQGIKAIVRPRSTQQRPRHLLPLRRQLQRLLRLPPIIRRSLIFAIARGSP